MTPVFHDAWSAVYNVTQRYGLELALNATTASAAALFGTLGAQALATRTEKRQRLRSEIVAINQAIALTLSVANSLLSVKKQTISPLILRYRTLFLECAAVVSAGRGVVNLRGDLLTIRFPEVPIDPLRHVIFTKLNSARVVMVLTPLMQSVTELAVSITHRNQLDEEFLHLPPEEALDRYFGLRQPNGTINEVFPHLMMALESQDNEGLYFSELLIGELQRYGNHLRAQLGKSAPAIAAVDLSRAVEFMPKREDYPDWERQFRQNTLERRSPFESLLLWLRIKKR